MKILSEAFRAANHIRIANLPPLTTKKELRKILQQNGLKEIENVALLYKRFKPTNEALIALRCPSYLEPHLSTLNKLDFYGAKLKAQPYIPQDGWDLTNGRRSRGHKGRKEAAERGSWNGDGPNAGIRGLPVERVVTIWGFPGKATVDGVEKFLEAFKISRTKDGEAMIYKIPLPPGAYSLYSRFVVVLDTEEEAQLVVQTVHRTQLSGKPHIIYAQAIY